jgi:hypothetical protein
LGEKARSDDEEEETKPCLTQTDENERDNEDIKSKSSFNKKSSKKNEFAHRNKSLYDDYYNDEEKEEDEDENEEYLEEIKNDEKDDDNTERSMRTKSEPRRQNERLRETKYEITAPTKSETISKMKKKFSFNPNERTNNEMDYNNFNNFNQFNPLIGNPMLKHQLSSSMNNGMHPFDQMNNMYGYNNMPNMDYIGNMGGTINGNNFEQANQFLQHQNGMGSNFKSYNLKSKKKEAKKRFDLRVLESLNDY